MVSWHLHCCVSLLPFITCCSCNNRTAHLLEKLRHPVTTIVRLNARVPDRMNVNETPLLVTIGLRHARLRLYVRALVRVPALLCAVDAAILAHRHRVAVAGLLLTLGLRAATVTEADIPEEGKMSKTTFVVFFPFFLPYSPHSLSLFLWHDACWPPWLWLIQKLWQELRKQVKRKTNVIKCDVLYVKRKSEAGQERRKN